MKAFMVQYKNKKGFTFVELIVVITIIFIMTAVMISLAYRDRSKKEVSTTARTVSAVIRETQNNALTGKQRENNRMPCAFKFKIGNDGKTYRMFRSSRGIDTKCPPDTDDGVSEDLFDDVQLPDGVTISATAEDYNDNIVSKDNVIFLVPYGDFIVEDKASNYKGIEFVVQKDSKKYVICVHATGMIEEIGFQENTPACAF